LRSEEKGVQNKWKTRVSYPARAVSARPVRRCIVKLCLPGEVASTCLDPGVEDVVNAPDLMGKEGLPSPQLLDLALMESSSKSGIVFAVGNDIEKETDRS